MKRSLLIVLLVCSLLPASVLAGSTSPRTFDRVITEENSLPDEQPSGYLARIERNNPAEIEATLKRAEQIYLSGKLNEGLPPVTFIIHGPEAVIFLQENYDMYMELVDLASRLSTLNVVDIKVCEARLGLLKSKEKPLQPFVETVKFGPREAKRLRSEEGYEYFYPTADSPTPGLSKRK